MRRILSVIAMTLLAACATLADNKPAGVERMYVISCGENHVKDLSRWTPNEIGRAHV